MDGSDVLVGNEKERWIQFRGGVNEKSGPALMRLADEFYHDGPEHIHLLISSLGGNVYHGVNLFSHLRHLGIKISTHNTSTVQSIGVTLFCAGDNRYCVPEGTFMMHPIGAPVPPVQMMTAKQFQDLADSCTAQTRSIAQIVGTATGQNADQVFEDMNRTIWLNAEQSLAYGLVNTVTTHFLPPGTKYTVVEEDGTVRAYPLATLTIPPALYLQKPGQVRTTTVQFPPIKPN